MTPHDELRVKIAERLGWRKDEEAFPPWNWINPNGNYSRIEEMPAFRFDLNAIAEAEATLTDEQHNAFRLHLKQIACHDAKVSTMTDKGRRAYISATAEQRARAFLLAVEEPANA